MSVSQGKVLSWDRCMSPYINYHIILTKYDKKLKEVFNYTYINAIIKIETEKMRWNIIEKS